MDLNLKKTLATGAAIAALLANSTIAFAGAEATCEVGDDGTSSCTAYDNDNLQFGGNNSGGLFNLDAGVGISGLNDQSGNDDDNFLGTGSSDGWGASDNFLNSNINVVGDDDSDGSADADSEVGEDGDASAWAYDNDNIRVRNSNDGEIFNLTLGLAMSGGNTQSGNDDGNEMMTGEAEAMASALNELNNNWTMIDGGHTATAEATVGDDGTANSWAYDNDTINVSNYNSGSLMNVSVAAAVSGFNTQSGNDDENSLTTGSSSADSDANNFVNNNITVVGGGDAGSASATSDVGEDGTSDAWAYDNDTVTVQNQNEAEVENISAGVAVSGGNDQSGNDDGNSMTTGSSSGTSCSSNTVNSNWTTFGADLPEGSEDGCN